MNRRRFIYNAALGLMVPAAIADPRRVVTVLTPRPKQVATAASETLMVSLGESDTTNGYVGFDTTTDKYGWFCSWTPSSSFLCSKVEFYGYRSGATSLTRTLIAYIYSSTGTAPDAQLYTGNTLTFGDIDTSAYYMPWTFANVQLDASTQYFFGLFASNISTTTVIYLRYKNTGSLRNSFSSTSIASPTWGTEDSTSELRMKIYGY